MWINLLCFQAPWQLLALLLLYLWLAWGCTRCMTVCSTGIYPYSVFKHGSSCYSELSAGYFLEKLSWGLHAVEFTLLFKILCDFSRLKDLSGRIQTTFWILCLPSLLNVFWIKKFWICVPLELLCLLPQFAFVLISGPLLVKIWLCFKLLCFKFLNKQFA